MNAERVCYLDSSAIVKLVAREKESAALRRYLRGRSLVSSALARVEVARAVTPHGIRTLRKAAEVLSRIDLVRINNKVLSRAASMEPADLRTLDAIHLATASLFGGSLSRFVCYDGRLASAAEAGDWNVVAPG
jgi:predicted nucleic acid-binding protein